MSLKKHFHSKIVMYCIFLYLFVTVYIFSYEKLLKQQKEKRTYVVILCGSSISMSISSLVASVTELVWDVKRLPLPIGNTLFTLLNSRTSLFDVQSRSRENALQPTDVSCHLNLANQLLFPREISKDFLRTQLLFIHTTHSILHFAK